MFYGQLEYFTAMSYFIWTFGNLVVVRYIFIVLVYVVCQEKSGNPVS
jgi:hypothetical protein